MRLAMLELKLIERLPNCKYRQEVSRVLAKAMDTSVDSAPELCSLIMKL